MTVLTENIPGVVIPVPGGPEVCRTRAVTWNPIDPDRIMFGLHDRVLWVTRDGWRLGTEALHIETGGRKRIYPVQCGDVHWTVIQAQTPGLPPLRLYVQTWRVTDFIAATYCPVPSGWAADFDGLADDAAFDSWHRSLAGAA